jgi:hypothetical protein
MKPAHCAGPRQFVVVGEHDRQHRRSATG